MLHVSNIYWVDPAERPFDFAPDIVQLAHYFALTVLHVHLVVLR